MSNTPEPPPDGTPGPSRTGRRQRPVFLEKASYRRRRLTDAVRLMPLLGGLLWAVPMLWSKEMTATSAALLYVFGIWLVLVIGAGVLSRKIGAMPWSETDDDKNGDAL